MTSVNYNIKLILTTKKKKSKHNVFLLCRSVDVEITNLSKNLVKPLKNREVYTRFSEHVFATALAFFANRNTNLESLFNVFKRKGPFTIEQLTSPD